MKAKPIPLTIRRAVADRSGGVCEFCSAVRAVHTHHRKLRSQGGEHTLENLIHLCEGCHSGAHANPDRSYALGLLVRGWQNPADVPVTRTAA